MEKLKYRFLKKGHDIYFADAKVPINYQDKLQEPDEEVAITMILSEGNDYQIQPIESENKQNAKLQSLNFIEYMHSVSTKNPLLSQYFTLRRVDENFL